MVNSYHKIISMANKKKYYGLDDVGFVGVAKERSEAEFRQDAKRTSDYIKNYRSLTGGKAAKGGS